MKFNGTLWVDVGTPGFSTGSSNLGMLAITSDGVPYFAYRDWDNSNKATVMKFD